MAGLFDHNRLTAALHQVGARLADAPARAGLHLSNTSVVSRRLAAGYARAVSQHAAHLPALSGEATRLVRDLRQDGLAVTDATRLAWHDDVQGVIAEARRMGWEYAAAAHERARRGEQLHHVPPDQIEAHADVFRLGLDPELLDIAENYLGLPVGYDGAVLVYTVADGREVSTRRWHRDWEDRSTLKIAIYLNDVDAEGGPFQLISKLDPRQNDRHGFRYAAAGEDDLIRMLGDDCLSQLRSVEGPAGTVLLADTAQYFHRGAPAVKRDRIALFYSYFAAQPRHPFLCERSGLSRNAIRHLVTDCSPRQQAAALWFDQRPLWLRMIPPASL